MYVGKASQGAAFGHTMWPNVWEGGGRAAGDFQFEPDSRRDRSPYQIQGKEWENVAARLPSDEAALPSNPLLDDRIIRPYLIINFFPKISMSNSFA